jgi:hypothetical protein
MHMANGEPCLQHTCLCLVPTWRSCLVAAAHTHAPAACRAGNPYTLEDMPRPILTPAEAAAAGEVTGSAADPCTTPRRRCVSLLAPPLSQRPLTAAIPRLDVATSTTTAGLLAAVNGRVPKGFTEDAASAPRSGASSPDAMAEVLTKSMAPAKAAADADAPVVRDTSGQARQVVHA